MRFHGSPDRSGQLGDGASRDGPSSVPPPRSREHRPADSRPRARLARIALADPDGESREMLRARVAPFASEIHELHTGSALEDALSGGSKFQLVIASARLPEPSALQVLARVRRHGLLTPFIIVTSMHGNFLRVFVSDAEGTVLSSRVVDEANLATLISSLVDRSGI